MRFVSHRLFTLLSMSINYYHKFSVSPLSSECEKKERIFLFKRRPIRA